MRQLVQVVVPLGVDFITLSIYGLGQKHIKHKHVIGPLPPKFSLVSICLEAP